MVFGQKRNTARLTTKDMKGVNQKTASGLSATLNMNKNNYQGSVRRGVWRFPSQVSKGMVGCIAEMGEC